MIEFRNVSKSFFGTPALRDISFVARPGRILALLGQNGAGKSTMMKILSGAYGKDSGEVFIDGDKVEINSPSDAEKHGVGIVYQELSGVPHLTVAENIVLGKDPVRGVFLDFAAQRRKVSEALAKLGIDGINPGRKLRSLGVSQQQLVEIAKCISQNPRIVIFDEPTTSLTSRERGKLFEVVKKMRADGLTIIYISHFLEEVQELADDCLILRDGQVAYAGEMAGMDNAKIVGYMIGQKMRSFFPEYVDTATGETALELEGFGGGPILPLDLKLRYGEVLGLSGLIGSGRTELAKMIIGADRHSHGSMRLNGKPAAIRNINDALRSGIAYINEDRRIEGLNLTMDIAFNMSLPSLAKGKRDVASGCFVSRREINRIAGEQIKVLDIKCVGARQKVMYLSGGNQQKVSIGKWIASEARIYIFDEPTKGIDVLAKSKVFEVIRGLAAKGCAVIVISSYDSELLGICDRIQVMAKGRKVNEFGRDATEHELLLAQQL